MTFTHISEGGPKLSESCLRAQQYWGLEDRVGVTNDFTLRGTWLESCLWGFQHGAGLGKMVQLGTNASFSSKASPGFSAPADAPRAFPSTAPTCLETEGAVNASAPQLPASPEQEAHSAMSVYSFSSS